MRHIHKLTAIFLVFLTLFSCFGGAVYASEEPALAVLPDTAEQEEEEISSESELIAEEEHPAEETVSSDAAEPSEEEQPAAEAETPAAEEDLPVVEPVEETAEPEEATEEITVEESGGVHWAEPGNAVEEILGGGTMLTSQGRFYYSEEGIWLDYNGSTHYITAEEGFNLNLVNGWLYYTVDRSIRRVPMDGGNVETVCTAEQTIETLFVMDWELRYLAGGILYSYDMRSDTLDFVEAPGGVLAFIPTIYGNIFLCGAPREYTLVVNDVSLASDIRFCYTAGESWLVVDGDNGLKQLSLQDLFEGVYRPQEYTLYDDLLQEYLDNGLTEEEELANEAAFLAGDEYLARLDALDSVAMDGLYYVGSNPDIAYLAQDLTSNQTNIVLRGRQMAEVEWTPLKDRYSWGGNDSSYVNNNTYGSKVVATDGTVTWGYYKAGKTYRGVPYSQAVYTGYVGWNISLSNYIKAINDSSSKFYSGYSTYSRTAPYYGSDCSGFVSWAWQTSVRRTCTSLLNDSEYIGKSISLLQVGDCLNNPNSHVVLITDLGYDSKGNIVSVEITEQTPAKMRVNCYGEQIPGKYYDSVYSSLSSLTSYYFNGGYSIYRRDLSSNVTYTPSDAVDLDKGGYAPAPKISVSVNSAGNAKVVTLSHVNSSATIYYTTDGSAPTTSGIKYIGPFELTKDTTVRAVADCGSTYSGYHTLSYSVTVSKAQTPFIALVDGDMNADEGTTVYVSSGSKIALINENMDTVYYTTDGSTPTTASQKMPTEGITVNGNMTLKAVAASKTDLNSNVVTYKVNLGTFHTITASATEGGILSPSGAIGVLDGSDFTFNISTESYYKLADVKVDGVSVGTPSTYTFRNVTGNHTISVSFKINLPFTDVNDRWYTDSIRFVYANGLFNGVSETRFMPEENMTRGMFVTVLGRFARAGKDLENWSGTLGITNGSYIYIRGKTSTSDTSQILATTGLTGEHIPVLSKTPASSSLDGGVWYKVKYGNTTGFIRETNPSNGKKLLYVYSGNFTDLPDGEYYTGYAQWGNTMGIIQGFGDGTFGPDYYVTRQDICVLLYRYLTEYRGYTLSSTASTFNDDRDIAGYAKTAVYAMKKIGVVNGYENGYFYPNDYATRAEVATMFSKLHTWMNS